MDEPCSALDPIATSRIEDLIVELNASTRRHRHAQHAAGGARADVTAFMYLGRSSRTGETTQIFGESPIRGNRALETGHM